MSKQFSTCLRWDVAELRKIGNEEGWSNISRILASPYFAGAGLTVGDVLRMVNHQNGQPGAAKGARYRTRFLDGEWEIKIVQGHGEKVMEAFGIDQALEEITLASLRELAEPFFQAYTTSNPKPHQIPWLQEIFARVPPDSFTLHGEICLNNGRASNGDVVSMRMGDTAEVGELLMTVGINNGDTQERYSIISIWDFVESSTCTATFRIRDNTRKVPTKCLDTVFTHRESRAGAEAMLLVPYECRSQL